MNYIERHIKDILIFTFLWSLMSCNKDIKEPLPEPEEVSLSLGFRMAPQANIDGQYEEGETYENYIDVAGEDYRIYFFDMNDKFIARFQPNIFFATEGSNYIEEYNVRGEVSASLVEAEDEGFKVVVIANWPQYPDDSDMKAGETTIETLCNSQKSQFDQFESFVLSEDHLIPFFGVREYSNITFKPDEITILPAPVTLLRSVAKVEVILKSETGSDLSFRDVQICRYNKKGFCAPSANVRENYDHDGNWNDDYAEGLHLVGGKNDVDADNKVDEKNLSLQRSSQWIGTDGYNYQKWIAYLTEYQNIDVEDDFCFIEAKFENQLADDLPHKIYFAEYTDGQTSNENSIRLNVERNNLYRFTVEATPLQLLVSVDKWIYGGKVHIDM